MMKFFWRALRRERGFTLIELLIVVAIIAILAAILIPNFLRSRAQAQVSSSKSNLRNLGTSLEGWFIDNPATGYPDELADLAAASPAYIRTIQTDPCVGEVYDVGGKVPYTPTLVGTVNTSYIITVDLTGTRCAGIVDGNTLSYTPDGGLQEGSP